MGNDNKSPMAKPSTSSDLDKMIGARLKFFRLAREVTQTALGRKAGITFQQIQKYENGTNRITASRLVDFARILEFSMAEFFDGISDNPPKASGLPGDLMDAMTSPQTAELNRYFAEMDSDDMRQTIINLVKEIGGLKPARKQ